MYYIVRVSRISSANSSPLSLRRFLSRLRSSKQLRLSVAIFIGEILVIDLADDTGGRQDCGCKALRWLLQSVHCLSWTYFHLVHLLSEGKLEESPIQGVFGGVLWVLKHPPLDPAYIYIYTCITAIEYSSIHCTSS